ncbi:MAG: translation initiation factor IF-2 subunit gamma [archaeon]
MENNEDISKLEVLNIGIVGHIDHGKTTLLHRMTGKWTDTHSEELKRGITIKLGYADAIIRKQGSEFNIEKGNPVRYITFVDAPGHEMLMATMLSGAAIMDAAVLVIAANEGIKPQTREHLIALKAKNIKNVIIVQNKIDLITKEQAKKSYEDIKKFIKGTIAENSQIIPVSAQQGINIDKILEELTKIPIPQRNLKEKPCFVIARSFDINRPGTGIDKLSGGILGGSLKQGTLKIGDEIEIKPGINYKEQNQIKYESVKTRIMGLQRGAHPIKEATPGGSLAIQTALDPSVTKADSLAGCVASLQGQLADITSKVKIKFHLFKEILGSTEKSPVENIRSNEMLLLSINTAITVGTVLSARDDEAELILKIPVVPFKGENIGIARNIKGHWRLIGYGELIQ